MGPHAQGAALFSVCPAAASTELPLDRGRTVGKGRLCTHPAPFCGWKNKQTQGVGEEPSKNISPLFFFAYHKSKHNIFSFLGPHEFLTVQLGAVAHCLEEFTKEIESLVSNCKYPPLMEFVCSAAHSGVTGCGTPWHQVTGGKDPLLR